MAKAIIKPEQITIQGGQICMNVSPVLDTGDTFNISCCVPIPITATQLNNNIKDCIKPEILSMYGITLTNNDIIILGGAV